MDDYNQLLVKIAYYYYRKGLTQGEIADKLLMSRQRVNRLLKKVWGEGIVSITINGLSESYIELESQLEEIFKLKRAIVIPNPHIGEEDLMKDLSKAGANYLMSMIKDNLTIGIAWGRTLYNLGLSIPLTPPCKGISVIQLVGSLNLGEAPKQSDEITRIVAQKLSAQPYFIFAPTYMNNVDAKEIMMKEESIKIIFDKMKTCDVILYSIGEIGTHNNSFKKIVMSQEDQDMIRQNAVGNLCMWYFDIDGKILDIALHKRLMSIDTQTLKEVPDVVCIAGGVKKEKAIYAGLKGNMMNTLITDQVTANSVLKMSKQTK
ncbi:MAG: sugar-binding transcriptional regulator [Eubacteriales bacterium]